MLESIVLSRRQTAITLLHQIPHMIRCLPLTLLQHKSVPKVLDRLRLETRQPEPISIRFPRIHTICERNLPAVQHQDDAMRQLIHIWPHRQERLNAQLLEAQICLRVDAATHDQDHLRCELKWCTLERDSSWCNIETEPEIFPSVSLRLQLKSPARRRKKVHSPICRICPASSNMIFPLCRSLNFSKYEMTEYPAILFTN